jgi:hypothetical protein
MIHSQFRKFLVPPPILNFASVASAGKLRQRGTMSTSPSIMASIALLPRDH